MHIGQTDRDLFAPRMDQNDEQLLSDLMSDNPTKENDNQTGFSAQWNALFGDTNESSKNTSMSGVMEADRQNTGLDSKLMSPSSEFGDFMSAAKPFNELSSGDTDLFGILKNKDGSKTKKDKTKSFLPSQLFDLDQSLYSQQSPRSGKL